MSYHVDLAKATLANDHFRRELHTTPRSQVVVMALKPGEDIGLESHDLDQVLYIVQGDGECVLGDHRSAVGPGHVLHVPSGVMHNVINTGGSPLKLFTIYAPPEHAAGTVHRTKAEAEAAERAAGHGGGGGGAAAGGQKGPSKTIGSLIGAP